jgi:hypothetical protein
MPPHTGIPLYELSIVLLTLSVVSVSGANLIINWPQQKATRSWFRE